MLLDKVKKLLIHQNHVLNTNLYPFYPERTNRDSLTAFICMNQKNLKDRGVGGNTFFSFTSTGTKHAYGPKKSPLHFPSK